MASNGYRSTELNRSKDQRKSPSGFARVVFNNMELYYVFEKGWQPMMHLYKFTQADILRSPIMLTFKREFGIIPNHSPVEGACWMLTIQLASAAGSLFGLRYSQFFYSASWPSSLLPDSSLQAPTTGLWLELLQTDTLHASAPIWRFMVTYNNAINSSSKPLMNRLGLTHISLTM